MSAESVVVTELQGHVLSIRINRPDKKNAINIATYHALSEAFRRAHSDAAVRAVLIHGSADCFSSGNDMSDFLSTPDDIASSAIGGFMMSLLECGKPVVAAVNGPAIGIGVTMLLHCDLVYVGENARLQMPFVNIGICPEFGSSLIAPAIMGHARAAELILLGEAFTAAKAREYGLVNEVLPDADVLARAQERAAKLAAQPPNAMRTSKQLMKRWALEQLRQVVGVENGTFVPMLKMPEAIEAISAFQQKRKPDFSKFGVNPPAAPLKLPLRIEEITPQWLSAALSEWTPGVHVTDIEEMLVIPGTTTKIRLKLRYAEPLVRQRPSSPPRPPTTLCIKGGFDKALREIVAEAYQLEANFFAEVAPTLSVPLPHCWYAGTDLQHDQGIIVLEDLLAAGATFGDPLTPWSVDAVAAALEVLAQLHGQTWGATPERFPCLQNGSWVRKPAELLLGETNWQRCFAHDEAASLPTALRDRKRVHQALLLMWHYDDREAVPCLSHADPHIGNTYRQTDGKPRFLDWQVACLAPGNDDAAYFISGALTVADRRSEERHLLKHYLDAVAGYGGPRQRFDAAWLDYRRHQMHGFLWAVTPPEMQTPARVAAMGERHIAAIVDHETLALLEALNAHARRRRAWRAAMHLSMSSLTR